MNNPPDFPEEPKNITLSDSVTYLGGGAFTGCSSLTNIVLSQNITNIDSYTFSSCASLRSLTLPRNVTQFVTYAVDNCPQLTQLVFQGNAPVLVGSYFQNSPNMTVYYYAGTTGWSPTYAGLPTAVWTSAPMSFSQWAATNSLAEKFPNASGENDDADHDGLTNLQEMNAGTDPTSAKSALAFEMTGRAGDLIEADRTPLQKNQFALFLQTIPGKSYDILSCDQWYGAWKTVTTVNATTTQKRVVLERPTRQAFYRVMIHR